MSNNRIKLLIIDDEHWMVKSIIEKDENEFICITDMLKVKKSNRTI